MSSIGLWEQFLGVNWQRYSEVGSTIACITCAGVGVLSLLVGFHVGVAVWTILIALLLAVWEFPIIFSCVPNFEAGKEFLLERGKLKLEETRAALYIVLSILTFPHSALSMLSGVALMIAGVMMGFAAINRRADEGSYEEVGASSSTSGGASGGYQVVV